MLCVVGGRYLILRELDDRLGRGGAWRGWCDQHRAGLRHEGPQTRPLGPPLLLVVQKIKLP